LIRDASKIEFEVKTPEGVNGTNFMALQYLSDEDEEIYGMGL
jgi:hypothetical protein